MENVKFDFSYMTAEPGKRWGGRPTCSFFTALGSLLGVMWDQACVCWLMQVRKVAVPSPMSSHPGVQGEASRHSSVNGAAGLNTCRPRSFMHLACHLCDICPALLLPSSGFACCIVMESHSPKAHKRRGGAGPIQLPGYWRWVLEDAHWHMSHGRESDKHDMLLL